VINSFKIKGNQFKKHLIYEWKRFYHLSKY